MFHKKTTSALLISILFIFIQSNAEPMLQPDRGLRSFVISKRKKIGTLYDDCCISPDSLFKQEKIIQNECSIITNGNFFIPKCHPQIDNYNFIESDRVNLFAKTNNLEVRGHTLVWYAHVPAWLDTAAGQSSLFAKTLLKNHVSTVVEHNKNFIKYWDVINEPLDDVGTRRKSFYEQLMGPQYIDSCLMWAHNADPSALLFINEYSIEFGGQKCDSLYALAKRLLKNNIPLHGIGFQCHFKVTSLMNFSDMKTTIKKFSELGLRIHFTEIDIRMPDLGAPLLVGVQCSLYRNLVKVFKNEPACDAFVVWGFFDGISWIPRQFEGWGNACLFDKEYQPKKTFLSIVDELKKQSVPTTPNFK